MARKLPSIIPPVSTRENQAYEYGQREVENIDRAAWHGEHPMRPSHLGNFAHTEEVATHIPTPPRSKSL